METRRLFRLTLFFFPLWIAWMLGGLWLGTLLFASLAHLPHTLIRFDLLFKAQAQWAHWPPALRLVKIGFALASVIAVFPLVLCAVAWIGLRKKESLHGDARFATIRELEQCGLLPSASYIAQQKLPDILLGKYRNRYVRFFGTQFVALAAPTRSGKGVSAVITNLLHYRDSVVVLDTKRENFEKTGGFRAQCGQEVYLFSPDGYFLTPEDERLGINVRSHRWNPLSYIRRNALFRDGDVMTIAKILYPSTGSENDVWNESAANLFKGLVLYLINREGKPEALPVTMASLIKLMTPDGGLAAWMQQQMRATVAMGDPLSDNCLAEFNRFVAMSDRTASSVLTSLAVPLSVFAEAICTQATSGDDFDLRDVRRKRMSIYLGISPGNLPKYDRLTNLFFSQLISVNTTILPEQDPTLKVQCLLMLDEFAAMGRVNIIARAISYTACYNLRFFLIFQSEAQLQKRENYGPEGAKDIMDNCAVKLVFPPKEAGEEARSYSETLGYKTVRARSKGRSHGRHSSRSDNVSEQKRALMLPQEIVELGKMLHRSEALASKAIILMEKVRPFIADKIVSFDEPVFKQRLAVAQAHPVEVPTLHF